MYACVCKCVKDVSSSKRQNSKLHNSDEVLQTGNPKERMVEERSKPVTAGNNSGRNYTGGDKDRKG